jgi:hypothetical protein
LRGSLTENSITPIADATVNLIIKSAIVATTRTNKSGKYEFTIPNRLLSRRATKVYATTENWETISNSLSISPGRAKR